MPEFHNDVQTDQLALYLASGGSVYWAEARDIPARTACTWSRAPKVRDRMKAIRRAVVAEAVQPQVRTPGPSDRPGQAARAAARSARPTRPERASRRN
jgi:hypothetical protein